MAWKHAVSHTRHRRDPQYHGCMDRMLSYNCNCQYCVNFVQRISNNFPELATVAERVRHSIPLLHIEDHKDCKFKFSCTYIPNCGHFYGEQAEAPWVESNQVGAATRQMNAGHRIGVLSAVYTFWNWGKTIQMHITLKRRYTDAKQRYTKKRNEFIALCVLNYKRIPGWLEFEATKSCLPNGTVRDIYQHSDSHGEPSLPNA